MSAAKAKRLIDRLPSNEERKAVSADIPISKRDRFLKALEENDHTQRDVIEAAIDQYLEETGA